MGMNLPPASLAVEKPPAASTELLDLLNKRLFECLTLNSHRRKLKCAPIQKWIDIRFRDIERRFVTQFLADNSLLGRNRRD